MAINFGSKGRKKAPRTFGGQPTHTEQPHTEQPQRNEGNRPRIGSPNDIRNHRGSRTARDTATCTYPPAAATSRRRHFQDLGRRIHNCHGTQKLPNSGRLLSNGRTKCHLQRFPTGRFIVAFGDLGWAVADHAHLRSRSRGRPGSRRDDFVGDRRGHVSP